jgi:hypothetical protein
VDYRISSLESKVERIRDELTKMSDRVRDLETERERKKQFWETAFQALLTSVGVMTILVIWLGIEIASHAG